VTVSIIDQADLIVPTAKSTLSFEISGSAEIVATDNGDATDQTSFQSLEREAFNGLALVILRAKPGIAGSITLRVNSKDLPPAETTILAVPAASRSAGEPLVEEVGAAKKATASQSPRFPFP
jgi:beta-galactosidase